MKATPALINAGFFIFWKMAKCRIQNINPSCAYNVPGIDRVSLLDYEDFIGFGFDADDLYDNCLVTEIQRAGTFSDLEVTENAKYNSSYQNGVYTHTLETFISGLSADVVQNLHLGTKRRYVVIFRTNAGRFHVFGYEAGARLTYANQTDESTGALVTLRADSIYPLFEVIAAAFETTQPVIEFVPDFELGAYCIIQ